MEENNVPTVNPRERLETISTELEEITMKQGALESYKNSLVEYGNVRMDEYVAKTKFGTRTERKEAENEIDAMYAEIENMVFNFIDCKQAELDGRSDQLKEEAKGIIEAAQSVADRARKAVEVAQKASKAAETKFSELYELGNEILG